MVLKFWSPKKTQTLAILITVYTFYVHQRLTFLKNKGRKKDLQFYSNFMLWKAHMIYFYQLFRHVVNLWNLENSFFYFKKRLLQCKLFTFINYYTVSQLLCFGHQKMKTIKSQIMGKLTCQLSYELTNIWPVSLAKIPS